MLSTLYLAITAFVQQQGLGRVYFAPLDVILDEDSVVQPDLVLSPGTAHRDRGVKRRMYGRYGVQEYWLVDPQERTVEVTCLRNGSLETVNLVPAGGSLCSPLFPGLTHAVDDLFAEAF